MDKRNFFYYKIGEYLYYLDPIFHTEGGRLVITGASLFGKDGQYVGHWDAFNMPVALGKALKAWTKFNRSIAIAKSIGRWERERRQHPF